MLKTQTFVFDIDPKRGCVKENQKDIAWQYNRIKCLRISYLVGLINNMLYIQGWGWFVFNSFGFMKCVEDYLTNF